MKKYIALALTLILAISLLAGCGGGQSESESEEIQVGIVLPSKDETRWIQDEANFKTALEEAGLKSEVAFSQGATTTELANVDDLIEKKIKVLVLCSCDVDAAAKAVQNAKDAGVSVVCYDRLVKNTDAVDYYVTFDSYAVGAAQGRYLMDKYAGKKAVPLYLYAGANKDGNSFKLFAGAWSVLNKAVADGQFEVQNCDAVKDYIGKELDVKKDYDALAKIMSTIDTEWSEETAKAMAEADLKSGKKGDIAILAPNDGTARAFANAFSANAEVKSYVVTGQDADPASLKYIQEGKQNMTVWKDVKTLTKTTCDLVGAIISGSEPSTNAENDNGSKVVPSVEEKFTAVVDAENLQSLIDDGSFSKEDIDSAE